MHQKNRSPVEEKMSSVRERRRQRRDLVDGMPVAAITRATGTAEEV